MSHSSNSIAFARPLGIASQGIALCDVNGRSFTYAQLAGLAASTERTLRAGGIRADDRVALVLPNGPVAATAFLALGAASAVAPLNPAYTADECELYLRDLAPRLVVIDATLEVQAAATAARALGIPVAQLTPDPDMPGSFSLSLRTDREPVATSSAESNALCLLLHTSGTTSRPKLVGLTQANLVASARAIGDSLRLTSYDVCLNVMPLFHVHGLIGCVLSTWNSGGTVIATPGFSAMELEDWFERVRPTWLSAVPTMYQAIATRWQTRPRGCERLRFVRSCSAALPCSVAERVEALFEVPIVQAYGMTEAAHQIGSNPLPPAIRKPSSVGLPTGTEVQILSADGQPVPAAASGEVCVRGAGVIAGYIANEAANATSFFGSWFRTGDLGYLDEDGYLFLVGRIKEIINRAGEKIAPGEVEDALLELPEIAQAAVFPVPDTRVGEEVAAVLVLGAGLTTDVASVRARLARRLAAFKIPRVIVFRDEIPKGPTGKLQRIRLAAQLRIAGAEDRGAAATAGQAGELLKRQSRENQDDREREALAPILARMQELVAEVLGKPLGPDENFFDAGGDSLAATRLIDRVSTSLEVEVLTVEFFEAPTLRQLADVVATRQPVPPSPEPRAPALSATAGRLERLG